MRNFFDCFQTSEIEKTKPWLILGKGPSFSKRHQFDLSAYNTLSLNHAVREQAVTIAHIIDLDVIYACGDAIEKNAQLFAVENMVATQQMMVDPQTRWQTNGAEASTALQNGLKLDPNNPRLYYLQGESLFGTPVQFGGGKDKAKPVFEKAIALFKAAQPKPLYPNWGQKQAEDNTDRL